MLTQDEQVKELVDALVDDNRVEREKVSSHSSLSIRFALTVSDCQTPDRLRQL